jgi:hypothetical protein
MPIVHGYCELDELVDWNSATQAASVANLERAINAASRGIDQYCQRHFFQDGTALVPVARPLPAPCNPRVLEFGAFNDLASATVTVKTDETGDGVFETTWAASDYELQPINPSSGPEPRPFTSIMATGGRWFPAGAWTGRSARVEVTGVWGWPAVPDAITQACLILAARVYKRKDSPDGVSNWGDFGVIRVGRTDPDVVALLDPYRRTAVLVA